MNQMITVSFQLKASKENIRKESPVYVRLTINGVRTEFSTKRYVATSKWNKKAGIAKGTTEDVRTLNVFLSGIRDKLYKIHQTLLDQGKPFSVHSIKDLFMGKVEEGKMLMKIFEQHNQQMKQLVPMQFSYGTMERYNTAASHVRSFLDHEYKMTDIPVKMVTFDFIAAYEHYLKMEKKCSHNTAMKYITNLKKIINACMNRGLIDVNPFRNYKIRLDEVHRQHLSDTEIAAIAAKLFKTDRLQQVADIFLFGCFTGLAYADLKKLSPSHIVIDLDGTKWIKIHRTKTDTISRIPLLQESEDIIDKYVTHPKVINTKTLLPVISNQKMNEYLTEIASLCSISKELTMHVARHTCATLLLTHGVPLETVSEVLGHRHLPTTRKYAKLVDVKIKRDLQSVHNVIRTIIGKSALNGDNNINQCAVNQ